VRAPSEAPNGRIVRRLRGTSPPHRCPETGHEHEHEHEVADEKRRENEALLRLRPAKVLLHRDRRNRDVHSVGVGDDAAKKRESDDHIAPRPASDRGARVHATPSRAVVNLVVPSKIAPLWRTPTTLRRFARLHKRPAATGSRVAHRGVATCSPRRSALERRRFGFAVTSERAAGNRSPQPAARERYMEANGGSWRLSLMG